MAATWQHAARRSLPGLALSHLVLQRRCALQPPTRYATGIEPAGGLVDAPHARWASSKAKDNDNVKSASSRAEKKGPEGKTKASGKAKKGGRRRPRRRSSPRGGKAEAAPQKKETAAKVEEKVEPSKCQSLAGRLLSRYRQLVSQSPSAEEPARDDEAPPDSLASGDDKFRRQKAPHLAGSSRARLGKRTKAASKPADDDAEASEADDQSLPAPSPELPKSSAKIKPDRTFTFSAASVGFDPLHVASDSQPPVPTLAHGLERTLFNPGVHWLQDPRSRVYNFDPSIQDLITPAEFNYSALPEYRTSSKDERLIQLAAEQGKKYCGSTSSMTKMLSQIYLMLNGRRPLSFGSLSSSFPLPKSIDFTPGAKMPASVILQYGDGRYSIDADKTVDDDIDDPDANILSNLGHVMEKLFTVSNEEFDRFLKSSVSPAEDSAENAYAYGKTTLALTRSQLDCRNEYLPGNGTFDIKTRAVVAVRQDRLNHAVSVDVSPVTSSSLKIPEKNAAGYQIRSQRGAYESFEREYYDLIRSAFLKYQFQARIGQMDGIFVAYHNTQRVFGFEYVPVSQMDEALFGSPEEGDKVFKLCLGYMEQVLEDATAAFPEQSVAVSIWNNRKSKLLVFAYPASASVSTSAPPEDYVLFEYKNHNYLDGELVPSATVDIRGWVTEQLGTDDASERSSLDWSVFSQMVKHRRTDETDAMYMRMRGIQSSISQLTLPEGVSRRAQRAANWPETADEVSEEGEEGEDGKGFTPKAGKRYRSKATDLVKELRSLAKDGWAHQAEVDKLSGDRVVRIAPAQITTGSRPTPRRASPKPLVLDEGESMSSVP